jgi:regulatory protein YycI of two-component signal transduction system YycFG
MKIIYLNIKKDFIRTKKRHKKEVLGQGRAYRTSTLYIRMYPYMNISRKNKKLLFYPKLKSNIDVYAHEQKIIIILLSRKNRIIQ